MISARGLEEALAVLPGLMEGQKLSMPSKRKGYTPGIRAASKAIGISPTTYCRIENGKTPDVETLIKILKWLNI